MRLGLTPGPRLDEQNLRMGRRALVDVDDLIASQGSGDSSTISLLSWVKAMVVQASSCGVFGEQHPFLDPKVEEAFW